MADNAATQPTTTHHRTEGGCRFNWTATVLLRSLCIHPARVGVKLQP